METIGMLIGWAIFGLVAGAIARLLHPGREAMSWFGTMVLGILGSFLGGGIAYLLRIGTSPYEPGGWIMSILGAVVLLAIGLFSGRRRAL